MDQNKPTVTIFLSGAVVMVLELTGSRVLSPFFGSSIYIWTGMIGLILGFLSLGYYYGGIWADKDASPKKLAKILFYAAMFTFLLATFKEKVLILLSTITSNNLKLGSVVSISTLFGPVSFLLGCVTPIIVKQKLNNLSHTGAEVGQLYALSTAGSIFGTFLAGYYLIPNLGHTQVIYLCSLILFLLSFFNHFNKNTAKPLTIFSLIFLYFFNQTSNFFRLDTVADIDTEYNRILIRNISLNNKEARVFSNDKEGIQSAIYLNQPNEIVSDYVKAFEAITTNLPKSNQALMIGGAGYIFPVHFNNNNLGNHMDIVEIDPGTIRLAEKYFFLDQKTRSSIHIEDARYFPKTNNKKYDLIFLDAFNSIMPPHHLTTKEFFEDLKKDMTENGVLVINLISPVTGKNTNFLKWQLSTINSVFNDSSLYKIQPNKNNAQPQNLILIAYNSPENKTLLDNALAKIYTNLDSIASYDKNKILTDNYAPVEHLTQHLVKK